MTELEYHHFEASDEIMDQGNAQQYLLTSKMRGNLVFMYWVGKKFVWFSRMNFLANAIHPDGEHITGYGVCVCVCMCVCMCVCVCV